VIRVCTKNFLGNQETRPGQGRCDALGGCRNTHGLARAWASVEEGSVVRREAAGTRSWDCESTATHARAEVGHVGRRMQRRGRNDEVELEETALADGDSAVGVASRSGSSGDDAVPQKLVDELSHHLARRSGSSGVDAVPRSAMINAARSRPRRSGFSGDEAVSRRVIALQPTTARVEAGSRRSTWCHDGHLSAGPQEMTQCHKSCVPHLVKLIDESQRVLRRRGSATMRYRGRWVPSADVVGSGSSEFDTVPRSFSIASMQCQTTIVISGSMRCH
jgi:hypothetical protein